MTITAGLDVGGAHLKVALVEDEQTIAATQFPCPLWKGLKHLDTALRKARPFLERASSFAVTMTGELSDIFDNRKEGVTTLVNHLENTLPGKISFWCGMRGFQSGDIAKATPSNVASMNFLATATFAAKKLDNGLLVDVGSTTTDIIPLHRGKAVPRGLTDAERLETGELVYTGLTRTSLMGTSKSVPFHGHWRPLMHEHFATMADVYRVLENLPDGVDLHDTADGKGKSTMESVNRIAHMIGSDNLDGSMQDWGGVAQFFAEQQLRLIHDGAVQVISHGKVRPSGNLITAGIGAKIASTLADRLGFTTHDFADLANATPECHQQASYTAPAVAVARLLSAEVYTQMTSAPENIKSGR